MREDEAPVIRPYLLVDDIEVAVKAAEASGGEIAMSCHGNPWPRQEFAFYFQGGIKSGLWER